MDISKDITVEYISRIRHHEDILGVVLKGHLLIEHLLDLLIEKGMKQPKPILDDHRTFSFSVKSRLVFEAGLIDEPIFDNIMRVNRIRNDLAHNLSINEDKVDFKFSQIKDGEKNDVVMAKTANSRNNPIKK